MAGVQTIPDFLQWGEERLEPHHLLKYWGLVQPGVGERLERNRGDLRETVGISWSRVLTCVAIFLHIYISFQYHLSARGNHVGHTIPLGAMSLSLSSSLMEGSKPKPAAKSVPCAWSHIILSFVLIYMHGVWYPPCKPFLGFLFSDLLVNLLSEKVDKSLLKCYCSHFLQVKLFWLKSTIWIR